MNYHVRRSEREIKNYNEFRTIIKRCKYTTIGLSNNNEPYIVTLSYGYDSAANVLYFHCGKEGQKIDFIKLNSKACATIIEDDGFDADSCEHSYKSLIIRGNINLVNDINEIDYAIRLMIFQLEKKDPDHFYEKLKIGNKSYDNLRMLKMTIENITGKMRQVKIT